MTSPISAQDSHGHVADVDTALDCFADAGLLRQWRTDDPAGSYIVTTGNGEIRLRDSGQARAFIAGLRAVFHSTQRTTFFDLVAAADAMQTEAERLCDEANRSGLENDEFSVREAADELRARALGVAEVILGALQTRTGGGAAAGAGVWGADDCAGRD
ncbi:hypothetical protein [Actinoplanes rectilineatus]|uniref:hypothetical protein n=1 Tax=Actinoplanes rectilineatus TaxID=113571 RepID=UPI0012F8C4FC|nr:hypothetical protein [Actinoplanes rectilineatus]